MKQLYVLLGLAALFAASAGHSDEGPAPTLHVDMAEVTAVGAVQPVDGLTAGGQPDAAALKVFAEAGYVAVIDLRGPGENRGMADESAVVEELGLDYVAFPLVSRDDIDFDKAGELDRVLERYDGPVLLHCGSGNRVGAMLALRKSLEGASDEEALAYGRDGGLTGLEPLVRERLAKD